MMPSALESKVDTYFCSLSKNRSSLYLSNLTSGEKGRVLELIGSEEYRSKILSLGIVPGTEFQVLNGSQGCPYVLKINGTRLMLGWGMVQNIKVYAI